MKTAAVVSAKRSPELQKGAATAPPETVWNRPISSTIPDQEAPQFVLCETRPAGEAPFNSAQAGLSLALVVWAAGGLCLSFRVLRGWLRVAQRPVRSVFTTRGCSSICWSDASQVVPGRRLP